ncbi:MAG: hypothetical protein E7Y34_01130, partial [Mycoplasma sp.]|nr:hypothetical protein [Mycoplasma sp.]
DLHYSVFINYENLIISFKDVTEQENLYKLQWRKQNVFGEMEIDNFEQLQARLSINDMFQIYLNITNTLDKLTKEYDLIFHQYSQGKFFILTNYEILQNMINNSFGFLDTIKKNNPIKNIELSFSLGFAADFKTQSQLLNHSKKALEQAQTRGGDQVVVQLHNSPPSYYGAIQKLEVTFSKVEIKQFAKHFYNFLNQQTIKNVIIYGHINADLDAIGAAMGVYEIAKQCNKRAYIQNQIIDETTASYIKKNFDESLKKIFISSKQATKLTNSNTAIVIVDTSDFSRIENNKALVKADLNNVFIIDHHRLGKYLDQILPENIYINPNSSSTSEIVTEILTYINPIYNKFNSQTLQMLLNGIYLDTQFFRKNVSFATFNIASWLEKKGAKISIATNILKIPKSYATIIHQMLSDIEEIKPNYYLATTKKELPDNIISIIANEILKVENRKAAFVIAKIPNSKKYKLSARSNDVNVQVIAEAVGGGGHYDSAAAITNDELEIFKENLIQAIISRTTKIDYKL